MSNVLADGSGNSLLSLRTGTFGGGCLQFANVFAQFPVGQMELVVVVTTVEYVTDDGQENQSDKSEHRQLMPACSSNLLFAEFLDLPDDDSLFGGIYFLGALEGVGERVAEQHADGNGTITATCQKVGLILLQY